MKVLYVKSNSERAKEFQLRTVIYEKNSQKYVKKQAICKEAIPHLKKMKQSYIKLTDSIINKNIKLAKIIEESEDSLTFEFIDGIGFNSKFNTAIKLGEEESIRVVDEYIELLTNGFKTNIFDSSVNVPEHRKEIFGNINYKQFNGDLAYKLTSNIDLIPSNIIFKDDSIYIIDYEWVYDISIPVDLLHFRSIENMQFPEDVFEKIILHKKYDKNWSLITSNFIDMVTKGAYYNYRHNYSKNNDILQKQILELEEKSLIIDKQNQKIKKLNVEIVKLNKLCNTPLLVRSKNILRKKVKNYYKIHTKKYNKPQLDNQEIELPSEYNGEILKEISCSIKENNILCIFSHFDKDNMVDNYVLYYLKMLKNSGIDIIFVSTSSSLENNYFSKLSKYCRDIIVKENIGYDFGAWATGLNYIGEEINSYDNLILCNDSVYGPLSDINLMINTMKGKEVDFFGITDSYEIKWHLQSYFLFFNKNIITNHKFIDFFENYKVYKVKKNIIENYEIGLTDMLLQEGYKASSYCSSNELVKDKKVNITHLLWMELITEKECPILKIELLRDNPTNAFIDNWKSVLSNYTQYDTSLIENHLNRFIK